MLIFLLIPQANIFGDVDFDEIRGRRDEENPRRQPHVIMKDVKEKIDTEQIVFFSYATSIDLSQQDTAPIGVAYIDV